MVDKQMSLPHAISQMGLNRFRKGVIWVFTFFKLSKIQRMCMLSNCNTFLLCRTQHISGRKGIVLHAVPSHYFRFEMDTLTKDTKI